MKKTICFLFFSTFISLLLFFVLPAGHAQAQTITTSPTVAPKPSPVVCYALPYPGILPDHPLYPFKVLRDRIVLAFTGDPAKKIEVKIHLADKRLSMGKTLIEHGKVSLGSSTLSKGEKYLSSAADDTSVLITKNPQCDQSIIDRLLNTSSVHEQTISDLLNSAPVNEREGLGLSLQLSQEVLTKAKKMKASQ